MLSKSAVITGSTSGIGLGIAHTLAAKGVNILLNGLGDPTEIESIRNNIERKYQVKAAFSDADMTNPESIRNMVQMAFNLFNGPDILVNNAGIQFTARTENFPAEKWDAILAINLSSAFHCIKAALPGMQIRNFGRIINIASVHGLVGSTEKSAYVAAKHGMLGLTKVVALENAKADITCNAICPGWVLTPLVQKQIGDRCERRDI